MARLIHTLEPIFDKDSRVLILGSFPSSASRKAGFYYSHPQNRFWRIISYLTKTEPIPFTIDDKKWMLIKNRIALWDIINSCNTNGSSDSCLTDIIPADLSLIFDNSDIKQIFANGDKAYKLSKKYASVEVKKLPSTSSANAAYSLEKLINKWSVVLEAVL